MRVACQAVRAQELSVDVAYARDDREGAYSVQVPADACADVQLGLAVAIIAGCRRRDAESGAARSLRGLIGRRLAAIGVSGVYCRALTASVDR